MADPRPARLAALDSGQADFINNVPVHEVARLKRHPRVKIDQIEGLRMFFSDDELRDEAVR